MLIRQADGGRRPEAQVRNDRRDRTIAADHRTRHRGDFALGGLFTEYFCCQSEVRTRSPRRPDAPPPAVGDVDPSGVTPPREAGIARHLDAANDLLADDTVGKIVPLAGPGSLVLVGGRCLRSAAERERKWLVPMLGQDVDL